MQEPPLLDPVLLPETQIASGNLNALRLTAAIGLAAILGAGWWLGFASLDDADTKTHAAYSKADLGSDLVTPIDISNPPSLERALAAITVSTPEREQLRKQLLDGELQLGLIAFWDDVVADGDAVTITGAGIQQTVFLQKTPMPIVTPFQPGNTILVTAIRDGGGSVTVAVMTKNGPVHMWRLLVGESVEVATP